MKTNPNCIVGANYIIGLLGVVSITIILTIGLIATWSCIVGGRSCQPKSQAILVPQAKIFNNLNEIQLDMFLSSKIKFYDGGNRLIQSGHSTDLFKQNDFLFGIIPNIIHLYHDSSTLADLKWSVLQVIAYDKFKMGTAYTATNHHRVFIILSNYTHTNGKHFTYELLLSANTTGCPIKNTTVMDLFECSLF